MERSTRTVARRRLAGHGPLVRGRSSCRCDCRRRVVPISSNASPNCWPITRPRLATSSGQFPNPRAPPPRNRWFADSPPEGEGFEPSVPLESGRAERSNKPSCQPGKAVVSAAFGRATGEMADRADQRTPRREGVVPIVTASSRARAASTAAPLNRTRIAPVPVSRDCRSSPEHGVPCHHGEGVK